jgi:flagellar basal-body rod protein FlgF
MENSILIGLSRKAGLKRQMQVVATNLANMNTTGFKGSRMMFTDMLVNAGGISAPGGGNETVFVRDVATARNQAQGGIKYTENPLDVAIDGPGYFSVDGPNGPLYTRNGRFQLDENGTLVNDLGYAVLSEDGGQISIPADETDIEIAPDGTVSTEGGDLGKLMVGSFADPQALLPAGNGMLKSDVPPEIDGEGRVVQNALEGSNVQPIIEMEHMIRIHRSYKQVDTLIQQEDGRIKKMIEAYSA